MFEADSPFHWKSITSILLLLVLIRTTGRKNYMTVSNIFANNGRLGSDYASCDAIIIMGKISLVANIIRLMKCFMFPCIPSCQANKGLVILQIGAQE